MVSLSAASQAMIKKAALRRAMKAAELREKRNIAGSESSSRSRSLSMKWATGGINGSADYKEGGVDMSPKWAFSGPVPPFPTGPFSMPKGSTRPPESPPMPTAPSAPTATKQFCGPCTKKRGAEETCFRVTVHTSWVGCPVEVSEEIRDCSTRFLPALPFPMGFPAHVEERDC
ncbi:Uu.00g053860.m01.CDS01 [Anthostomella pinea]|uniref:Uu.00g053860.m01.CDS01 n=1 Tax=Anthostomella pinea TaxID=933095 RepID=A0AAI8VQT5_9PEZI|nr:Uu.00g053860.m01.CDS01 [Anthostomella pinea]